MLVGRGHRLAGPGKGHAHPARGGAVGGDQFPFDRSGRPGEGRDDKLTLAVAACRKTGVAQQASEGVLGFVAAGHPGRIDRAQLVEGKQHLNLRLLGKRQQRVGRGLGGKVEFQRFGRGPRREQAGHAPQQGPEKQGGPAPEMDDPPRRRCSTGGWLGRGRSSAQVALPAGQG